MSLGKCIKKNKYYTHKIKNGVTLNSDGTPRRNVWKEKDDSDREKLAGVLGAHRRGSFGEDEESILI